MVVASGAWGFRVCMGRMGAWGLVCHALRAFMVSGVAHPYQQGTGKAQEYAFTQMSYLLAVMVMHTCLYDADGLYSE